MNMSFPMEKREGPLLPPANEVRGKVMSLHLCVILFTIGGGVWLPSIHHKLHDQGGLHPVGGLPPGGLPPGGLPPGGLYPGVLPPGWFCFRGVCIHGGQVWQTSHGILRDMINRRALLECITVCDVNRYD